VFKRSKNVLHVTKVKEVRWWFTYRINWSRCNRMYWWSTKDIWKRLIIKISHTLWPETKCKPSFRISFLDFRWD